MRKFVKRLRALPLALILLWSLHGAVSANSIHTVDLEVLLHQDGSATITEHWDITMDNASNTEFYVAKHNLDNMRMLYLTVEEVLEDGAVVPFETLEDWDINATRVEKAGKCGKVRTNGGYEVCWGFGELGRHRYTVSYTLTNIVKAYEGGEAMSYKFLSDADGGVDSLNITLTAEEFDMEYPSTRVWVFGYEAESEFRDGSITVEGMGRFRSSDYAVIMLAFEPGLLSPNDVREETLDEIIDLNLEGSFFPDEEGESGTVAVSGGNRYGSSLLWIMLPTMLMTVVFPIVVVAIVRGSSTHRRKREGNHLPASVYNNAEWCRELPFGGSLPATYVRLCDMKQTEESAIIGCYLLEWIRTRQVEVVTQMAGVIRKREETAIKLYAARVEMPTTERKLYNMLTEAAGSDFILQNKEFERWARKNYSRVESWFTGYRQDGKSVLDQLGAYAQMPVQKFFGLIHTTARCITPLGEQLTWRMFGFRRYLQDFTILAEREAREVELWQQYMVFAQLFGIADQVAKQFQQLYPGFFVQQYNYDHSTDILIAMSVSQSFSRSMHAGYRSGASAAASSSGSSSSGGGGSSSSGGGGGGSSGGGGAGGR